jgi:carbonic anhydrase/acetyltransferase-like protein (isoleucine patch superfamily)
VIGIGGGSIPADPDEEQEVFLSFGAQVDGAILEQNTGVSVLGRVGPGVTLPSGMLVLPGKNVTTNEEAGDPAMGKVRPINEADVAFNEAVIEVNVAFAREYTELYRDEPNAVRGVSVDPGHTEFNPDRDLPSFAGVEQAVPGFRNRVIGDVDLADRFWQFHSTSGNRIALRADEGEPFVLGHVESMGDDVIFHALEHTDLHIGDGVRVGAGAIVHGGGRVIAEGIPDEPTRVGNDVTLHDESIVFRSTIGNGAVIGQRSAVVGTDLPPGTVVPAHTIILDGEVFGPVEW